MRRGKTWVTMAAICSLLAVGELLAQEAADDPDEDAPAAAQEKPAIGSVEPSRLDFWVRDKDGMPVRYLDRLTAEELEELIKRRDVEQAQDAPARYTVSQLVITGHVVGNAAHLDANLAINLHADGWTQIPLRFDNAFLQEKVKFDNGNSEGYVGYDPKSGQLVCWIDGKKGATHQLQMKFVAPVVREEGISRLSLSAAQATVSRLTLEVPGEGILPDGDDDLVDVASKKGATVLSCPVRGELAWRDAPQSAAARPVVLRTSSNTLLHIAGQNRISWETRLKVESLNGAFDAFSIQLPPGADLIHSQPISPVDATVAVVDAAAGGANQKPPGRRVDVRFPATTEPVEIQLFVDAKSAAAKSWQEIGGITVEGAIKDSGVIDVAIEGEWSVAFKTVDIEPDRVTDEMRSEGVLARYKYFRQPYSLQARIEPRKTRVTVDPVYVVLVDHDRVQIEARLSCIVDGASADQLEIDMAGWKVDSASVVGTPEGVLPLDALVEQPGAPLAIKLSPLAASSKKFAIRLSAEQPIAAGADKVSFTLPRPLAGSADSADLVTPAYVVVSPAPNVQLSPLDEELQALVVDPQPPQLEGLPENRQSPLFFRHRGAAEATETATFVGRFEVRPRVVTVDMASRVQADEQSLQVEQTLLYRIVHEPLESLRLSVPRAAIAAGPESIAATLDGVPLKLPDGPFTTDSNSPRIEFDVPLSTARLGTCSLVLNYRLPLPEATADEPVASTLPLIVPQPAPSTTIASNRLSLTGSEAVGIEATGNTWKLAGDATASLEFPYYADEDVADVSLSMTIAQRQTQASSTVHKAWVQTWLSKTARRDRAVYQLSSPQRQIRIQLPEGARRNYVAVGGRRVEQSANEDERELTIDLPDAERENVVELWYSFDRTDSSGLPWDDSNISFPRVVGARSSQRFYWQLAVPRDEHLWQAPHSLTPELSWRWQGIAGRLGYWERRAGLQQDDLERWIEASSQADLPEGVNQYLFSTFGQVDNVAFRTTQRLTVLIASSLAVLAAGTMLVFFPVLRHPIILLAAGLAVLISGLSFPEPAIQVAQAATLGLTVVLVGGLANLVAKRGGGKREIVRGTSLAGHEPNTTETKFPRIEGDSQASTAPLAIHVADRDSEG